MASHDNESRLHERYSSDASETEAQGMLFSEKPNYQADGSVWRRCCFSISQLVIIILAFWGIISLVITTKGWLNLPERQTAESLSISIPSTLTEYNKSGPYYPSTLPPGLNTCDCGVTIDEALERNCIYDSLAAAWLPPYCRDDNLTAEFERSGPAENNGEWHYFADEEGKTRLTKQEMGMLGEKGGSFWATRDWHIAHCLFYWQKYTRVRDTGVIMEERFDSLAHVKHCTYLATKKPPEFFFLISVPVRMNSSAGHEDHHHEGH